MVTIYSLNDLGRVFNFPLPSTITPGDVTNQKIKFYRPDGTTFEKDATKSSDVITYDNSSADTSILNQRGEWHYTAIVDLPNIPTPLDKLEVPEKLNFWVE